MVTIEEGRAPAAAYRIVSQWLHPAYFVRNRPPKRGVELVIRGTDNAETAWLFTPQTAAVITAHVNRHPELVLVAVRNYAPDTPPTEETT